MLKVDAGLSLAELLERPAFALELRGSDGEETIESKSSEEDESKDSDSGGKNEEDESKGKAELDAKDRRIAGLEEEKQRHYDKRVEAEAEVKALKSQIAQLEKDGTPDDALRNQNDSLSAENSKLLEENNALRLQNAFLTTNSVEWVDSETAFKLLDLDEVEIDEKTGKITGLKSAIEKLAKDKAYLLKPTGEEQEDEKKPKKSGEQPKPGKQNASDAEARRLALRKKYPGLRR